jgi:hypothetical protein
VCEISFLRYNRFRNFRWSVYIYIYNRTAMWTGLKTPASPIGATAEKLVTRSNDSWSKSSEEVRASKKKKVLNVLASARVVCLWQSVREWSEACSLLYFFPLDEEKKNKLPVVTVSLKKFSGS